MKSVIKSSLGQFVVNTIEYIIADGAFGYYGEQLELVGFNEGSYTNGQMIEYRFNRGMTNKETEVFYDEFFKELDKNVLCDYDVENVSYMTHRIYFKKIK